MRRIIAHAPLVRRIESFWLASRTSETWLAHRDIGDVMLATSLARAQHVRAPRGGPPVALTFSF